jgi:hypothetical protein
MRFLLTIFFFPNIAISCYMLDAICIDVKFTELNTRVDMSTNIYLIIKMSVSGENGNDL